MHSAKKLVDLPGTFRDLENTLQIEKYQLNLFKPYVKHIYLVRLDKLNLSEGISLSGNKLFKLLPNIADAYRADQSIIVSFGGPWSNHLYALAAAGENFGLGTVGIVRGERPAILTPTLVDAQRMGMHLHFVSRKSYKALQAASSQAVVAHGRPEVCDDKKFDGFKKMFGHGLIVPAGGSNLAGFQGTSVLGKILRRRLLSNIGSLWMASGTGSTLAGLAAGMTDDYSVDVDYWAEGVSIPINTQRPQPKLFAVPALRDSSLPQRVLSLLRSNGLNGSGNTDASGYGSSNRGEVSDGPISYCNLHDSSGYAHVSAEYGRFHRRLELELDEPIDHVYMGKVFYGLWQTLKNRAELPTGDIAVLHTGGLQGRRGLLSMAP